MSQASYFLTIKKVEKKPTSTPLAKGSKEEPTSQEVENAPILNTFFRTGSTFTTIYNLQFSTLVIKEISENICKI